MALESKRELQQDDYEDLPQTYGSEELESEVRRAKAELDELRRKQDQIEKEKLRLEELSRKQENLEEGKDELIDKLSRTQGLVVREIEECHHRLEQLKIIDKEFSSHLGALESIQPRNWSSSEIGRELSRCQGIVDDARSDFNKAQARIAANIPSVPAGEPLEEYEQEYEVKDFTYWLKSGFAFTLPLQLLFALALIIWIWSLLATK